MTPHPTEELSAYLDGDLDATQARAVTDHLASCPGCRGVVRDLTRLREQARQWGHDAATPARDLWPGIAARLTAAPAPPAPLKWHQRRVTIGIRDLALAASLVAGLAGTLLWQSATDSSSAPAADTGPAPVLAEMEPLDSPDAGRVQAASFSDAQYDAAVVDLERVLQEQRQHLNPRTVLVLERNLRIIDEALREARSALESDPANPLLNAHLADARRRKLDLLRRAALITEGD